MKAQILNPVLNAPLANGKSVEIKELSWPDALTLYKKLSGQVNLFTSGEPVTLEKIIGVISEDIETGTWLIQKATGKDDAWLNELSMSEVLDLATEAAVLNVGIILDRIKKVRSRLQMLVAGDETPKSEPKPSASSSTTTSPK